MKQSLPRRLRRCAGEFIDGGEYILDINVDGSWEVDVDTWAETLTTAVAQILLNAEDYEPITEITSRTRCYFVEEGWQSDLVSPRKISDTDLYLETNFSANDCVRIIEKAMDKYGYDRAEQEIFTEEA